MMTPDGNCWVAWAEEETSGATGILGRALAGCHTEPKSFFQEVRSKIARWIRWYNEDLPHQSLGYSSPATYRARQGQLVA